MPVATIGGAAPAPQGTARQMIFYWGIVAVWMTVISLLSTEPFSAANTNRYLDPVLRFFFPHLTAGGFTFAHTVIRKSAHLTEYFVLGCLAFWACRRGREPRWRAVWMVQALVLAMLYSLMDEAHQMFVPGRTPSLFDSTIDTLGAVSSQIVIYLRFRVTTRRRRRSDLDNTTRR